MEIVSTIILTVLCFYGLARLAAAIAKAEDERKARSDAAWGD